MRKWRAKKPNLNQDSIRKYSLINQIECVWKAKKIYIQSKKRIAAGAPLKSPKEDEKNTHTADNKGTNKNNKECDNEHTHHSNLHNQSDNNGILLSRRRCKECREISRYNNGMHRNKRTPKPGISTVEAIATKKTQWECHKQSIHSPAL